MEAMMRMHPLVGGLALGALACSSSTPAGERAAGTTSVAPPVPPAPTSVASAEPAAGARPALPVVDGKSFHDFCTAAFAKKGADELMLRHLEGALRVKGCDELERRLPELTSLSGLGEESEVFTALAKETKQEVTSLAALAYAIHLRRLELPYKTPVSDLRPLAGLAELTRLTMSASSVRDLSPLRGLTKLEILDVRTTKVTDIAPLMDLPALEDLDLRNLSVPKAQIEEFRNRHPRASVLAGRS
jgi:internalin A